MADYRLKLPEGFEIIDDEEEEDRILSAEELPEGFVEKDRPTLPLQMLPKGFEITDELERTPRSTGVTGEWELETESPWKKARDVALGTLETGMTLAGGIASLPVVGIVGLTGLPFGKAEEFMQKTSDLLVREPVTEAGEKITEVVSTPFRMINEAATFYGDTVYDKSNNPNLAAGVATVFELVTYALLAKGVKTAKGKITKAKVKPPSVNDMLKALEDLKTEPARTLMEEIAKDPKLLKERLNEFTAAAERLKTKPTLVEGKPVPAEERLMIEPKGEGLIEKVGERGEKLRVQRLLEKGLPPPLETVIESLKTALEKKPIAEQKRLLAESTPSIDFTLKEKTPETILRKAWQAVRGKKPVEVLYKEKGRLVKRGEEPKKAPPVEAKPEEGKVPSFVELAETKGTSLTGEALEWGVKASPEQIKLAKAKRAKLVQQAESIREEAKALPKGLERGKKLEESMPIAMEAQGLREAIEASEGRHPTPVKPKVIISEPKTPKVFEAVAVRSKDGTVYEGKPGEIHTDIVDRIPPDKLGPGGEYGFTDRKGKFYTRTEASDAIGEIAVSSKTLIEEKAKIAKAKPKAVGKPIPPKPAEVGKPIPYLNEQINYGGEIRTRGSVIAEMQKQGTAQKQIDAYMMGAKAVKVGKKRTLKAIRKDINTLIDEKGAISFEKLTPEQIAAKERLTKDLTVLNKKAKVAGKELGQYLKDQGVPANMASAISKFAAQKAIVAKGEEPKYAQSVNLQRQDISESGKALELAIAKKKKSISWKETGKKVEKILDEPKELAKTYQRLAKISKGKLTADIQAARGVNAAVTDVLGGIVEDFATGKIDAAKFNKRYRGLDTSLFYTTSDASSEIGRALNIHKQIVSGDRIIKGLDKLNKDLNPRQINELADINKKLGEGKLTSAQLDRFLKELPDPTLRDYVLEYWYNSILSGIPTHAVNIVSNTGWLMYQVPHRVHVALWDKLYTGLTGKARTRYVNEMVPMMAGYGKGARKGIGPAGKMITTGKIGEFETKWAREVGYGAITAWERSPHAWMRAIAPGVSFFTRALRAADVWANSIGYDGEMNSIARRLSKNKGLKGERRTKFETEFKQNPPDWAHEQSMKQAKHGTFMDDPDPFTQAFLNLREKVPYGIGHFIVPFVNTIGNLTKRGIEFTPGIGILKEAAARKMGRGMGTPEIIAKQVEGALLTLYILHKIEKGEIIGQGGKTKAQRERLYAQGKKPWSIKIGNTWLQYRRIEPFNTPIAAVTIAHDEIINAKDDATKTEIFMNVVNGMVNNWIDTSYFEGVQRVLNKYGKQKGAVERFGTSFVPFSSFWRSINRAYERYTEGDVKVREKTGWLSAAAQVIPGLAGKVPAELDVWGKEKVIPGSVFQHWLPWKWSKEIDDPLEKELARLNKVRKETGEQELYPGLPRQTVTIDGKKVKLDDDIYRKYAISVGNRAKTIILAQIKKASYQKRSDKAKFEMFDNILTSVRIRELRIAKIEQKKKGKKLPDKDKLALQNYYQLTPEDYLRGQLGQ